MSAQRGAARSRFIRYGVVIAAALIPALASAAWCWKPLDPMKAELMCRRFIEKRMMSAEGGIYTTSKVKNYLIFKKFRLDDFRRSGLLSESTGIMMNYAVAADDRELFDRQLKFTKKSLVGQIGLFFWKITHDGELTANSTASVDDLRIVGACLDAYEQWKSKPYLDYAMQVAQAIKNYEVVDGALRDFVNWRDWGEHTVATQAQLSYLDLPTMLKLSRLDATWKKILERNLKILKNGQLGAGLFYEGYDFSRGAYFGYQQNTINQLYCGLFLTASPDDRHELLTFFKEKMDEDGAIYAEYNSLSGEPTKFFESSSVYALLTRYALRCGDVKFAAEVIERLLYFQSKNRISPMYGSFCDDEVFSFDNLEALLALRYYNEHGGPAN
jgi:Glycosyl hydrolases family 8